MYCFGPLDISSLFNLDINIERDRSHFNNDKATKVWCLKSAKIAGKRMILMKPMILGRMHDNFNQL